VRTIEAFGSGCLGVNDRSVPFGVGDFSALSWKSVDVMFMLTINSIFWLGLKIDGVSPLRWAVSGHGHTPTYQPKVVLQIDGVSPLRWAVSGHMPTYRHKVASTCNLPYFPYPTLTLPHCPLTLLGWWG
jgi:hypothetical protein